MIKRMTALVLCLLLIAAVLPMGVSAAEDNAQQIRKDIQRHYYRALSASGKGSLSGYCGTLASYQLYYLGINKMPVMANGNGQYDIYEDLEFTETGYRVQAYAASDYTLEEALNTVSCNGTQDVYNILVGFQSTATAAGSIYGHAMVIYAILDGMVYFTESFSCSIVAYEGSPSCCTIEEFCDYYDSWTRFEGIIVFGQKDYVDSCNGYSTDLYVQTLQAAPLYTDPCVPGSGAAESRLVRTAAAGERLWVTGLYENTLGEYYYQVRETDSCCYIPAELAEPVRFNYEDIIISGAVLPEKLTQGEAFDIVGKVTSWYGDVTAIHMSVTDASGNVVLSYGEAKDNGVFNLRGSELAEAMNFGSLPEGGYIYRLYANSLCSYLENGQVATHEEWVNLCSVPFTVGEAELPVVTDQAEQIKDGWVWEQDTWYYYEQGTPRTGWFCYDGVDYYLQADGSVTTGWAEINGKARFFSQTGAMRTGWMEDEAGTYYLLSNGEAAHGWRTIEDKLYYFNENGILHADGWITIGEEMFYMYADGSAATGWVTLNDGTFCFQEEDGHLLVQAVEQDGETVLRAYDPAVGSLTDLPTLSIQNAATAGK